MALPDQFWRISNHADLQGRGGLYSSARWHRAGQRIVYLAESPPGALLEILVYLELPHAQPPKPYQLLKVVHVTSSSRLEWNDLQILDAADEKRTQQAGMKWLIEGKTALARVPSAIMPRTYNWLFNPLHPDAKSFEIVETVVRPYDQRLLRHVGI